LFGVKLEWVNDWWPAALILFGIYLVGRSVMARSETKAAA
jgi:hypothetical protein